MSAVHAYLCRPYQRVDAIKLTQGPAGIFRTVPAPNGEVVAGQREGFIRLFILKAEASADVCAIGPPPQLAAPVYPATWNPKKISFNQLIERPVIGPST